VQEQVQLQEQEPSQSQTRTQTRMQTQQALMQALMQAQPWLPPLLALTTPPLHWHWAAARPSASLPASLSRWPSTALRCSSVREVLQMTQRHCRYQQQQQRWLW
jgi:hypothetical protein